MRTTSESPGCCITKAIERGATEGNASRSMVEPIVHARAQGTRGRKRLTVSVPAATNRWRRRTVESGNAGGRAIRSCCSGRDGGAACWACVYMAPEEQQADQKNQQETDVERDALADESRVQYIDVLTCQSGGIGRRAGLKIQSGSHRVRVRVPPLVLTNSDI